MSANEAALPSARYARGVADGQWHEDPAQRAVLPQLDRLCRALEQTPAPSLWSRLLGTRAPAPHGLYLWGRVGRGKTFLSELLFDALTTPHKQRIHFHRFMQDVHARLRALEGEADPLVKVAAELAAELRILVLDEFVVGDIGDAMILGNLLRALFKRGVVLVTTSNTPPRELYHDGLQRERFLPAIALLEQQCEVVELASPTDWRLRTLKQAPVYYWPPDAAAEHALELAFARIAHPPLRRDFELRVNDRMIATRAEAAGVVWFDFAALCEGPRGVADYIELATTYHTIFLANVPQFTPQTEDAARRFIEFVDEIYDRGVNLVLSAATPIVELYDGARLRAEFARTESRLIEMQSEDYLAGEHNA
ncbi:MAG: AFG1 family ATPase [Dokdonella sp.]|uniref:cell division protein ZapE n=1 Tax=Dokdonella sp. TaxID=2291710 RepID=UPI0025BB3BBA|nr:cell division protein ZapE [Dokdonella sp.]MBZ0224154.1 AFG1 family ATPase [Dokdonella sp.]MCC7256013.1 AFG1 family ATPase [Dokdonella sp.]